MSDSTALPDLIHSIRNPLTALLAEVQLLLIGDPEMDDQARLVLQDIEKYALQMRAILKEPRFTGSPPAASPQER